jgi:23S rRNA (uracil1939-C5)-methyltransferase
VVDLRVHGLAHGGRGVARREGFVFLVDGALPGDLARVRIVRRRPSYAEAETLEILEPSSDRVPLRCEHAGSCGGCRWMALSEPAQLTAKRNLVVEALARVGGFDEVKVNDPVRSPRPFGYRNRVDLAFGWHEGELVVGFHEQGSPEAVFPLRRCHLPPPLVSELALAARDLLAGQGLEPVGAGNSRGFLRHLVIRINRDGSQALVSVVTGEGAWPGARSFAEALREIFPPVVGVVWSRSNRRTPGRSGRETLLAGRALLLERLAGMDLEVCPASFLQVNTEGAEKLYEVVLRQLSPAAGDRILDLYCGVGAISLLVARRVRMVLGVESDQESVHRAIGNARKNGITNVRFQRGDARRVLSRLLATSFRADRALVNPPRAGLDPRVVERLATLYPATLVYVSCHPPTLARDLGLLREQGYQLTEVTPVDLFPQTHHVEAVASLRQVT